MTGVGEQRTWLRPIPWALCGLALLMLVLLPISDLEVPGQRVVFAGILALAFIPFFLACRWLSGFSDPQALILLWIAAVFLRLLMLPLEPGNDLWRYIWEGMIQWEGFNPYLTTPSDPLLAQYRTVWWEKINHKTWETIYPPGAQWIFAGLSGLSPSPLVFKLAAMVGDLTILALILKMLRGDPGRVSVAAWYAWNPLVLYIFAGGGHYDSLMVAAMLGGFVCLRPMLDEEKTVQHYWKRGLLGGVLMGIAISIKMIPVLLLPLLFLRLKWRAWVLLPGICLPLLFALGFGWPSVPIFETLGTFSNVSRFNDWFWWLPEAWFGWNEEQKNLLYNRIIVVLAVFISFGAWWDWRRTCLWVLSVALVLSPVFHPWYLSWVLPMAVILRSRFWLVASCSIVFAYVIGDTGWWWEAWTPLPWQRWLVIGPPFLDLIVRSLIKLRSPPPVAIP